VAGQMGKLFSVLKINHTQQKVWEYNNEWIGNDDDYDDSYY
jgi:hypothetical protein